MGRRGDVARALLYMDLRYEGGTHSITGKAEPNLILTDDEILIAGSNTGENESIAYMGIKSVLLQWHIQDPVDTLERHRNEVVFNYQGNRNPFIDHPEWVECVFEGTHCGPPDFTGDRKTTIEDLAVLASFWGSDCSDPAWCGRTDINKSTKVDIEDLAIFLFYWLK